MKAAAGRLVADIMQRRLQLRSRALTEKIVEVLMADPRLRVALERISRLPGRPARNRLGFGPA